VAERVQTLLPKLTPIIFLTASKRSDFRQRAEQMGAVGYFEKPYQAEEVLFAVKTSLGE